MFEKIKSMFHKCCDVSKSIEKNAKRKWRIKKRIRRGEVVKDKQIEYLLNDRSTPELTKSIMPPESHHFLNYIVQDYAGGGYSMDSDKGRSANTFVTITNTLKMMDRYSVKPLKKWAGTNELIVLPMAGTDFNAFYNRKSMQFFYAYDPVAKAPIFTAESADIVAHELGHAILDSFRPETWGVASLEVWSFHEAFADLTALLSIMQHEEILRYVIAETNSNFMSQSVITRLAESMGRAIYNITGGRGGRPKNYLRTTINNFKYVNPGNLPKEAPHNKLAAECHSFGRVFLGAFYDILVMMYEDNMKKGDSPLQAIKGARDTLGRYVFKAIMHAPVNVKFYESFAKTMLWVDHNEKNRPYFDRMRQIFLDRNLMRPEIKVLSAPPVDVDNDGIVISGGEEPMILSQHIIRAQGQDDNPLYDVELTAAKQEAFLYDQETGQAIDHISVSETEVLSALQDMIVYLHNSGGVGVDETTPFEIVDGKLERTHFSW